MSALSPFRAVDGPLAHEMSDITTFFRHFWTEKINSIDQNSPSFVFDEEKYRDVKTKKPRIGYVESFISAPTSTAVKRSLWIAIEKLRGLGYEVVKLDLPE